MDSEPDKIYTENNKNNIDIKSKAKIESIKGFVGKLIEYPFDTIKVRLQVHSEFKGPIDCFKKSLQNGNGFKSLYRGISAPLIGSMLENSFMFMSYKQSQNLLSLFSDDYLSMRYLVLAGAMSGFFTSAVLTPVELVKCQIQVLDQSNSTTNKNITKSPFKLFVNILKSEGVKGIYKGHCGTAVREIGGNASWFGVYETSRLIFENILHKDNKGSIKEKKGLPSYAILISGALAGIGYNFSFYPIDALKSNMQTRITNNFNNTNIGYSTLAKEIYQRHGLKGFYRGCGITLFRAIPSNAVIFYTYESCSSALYEVLV